MPELTSTLTGRRSTPSPKIRRAVTDMRALAIRALTRMYLPESRRFVFRIGRRDGRDVAEGNSRRYTAITLIGLAANDERTRAGVLGSDAIEDVCGGLLDDVASVESVGDVALTLWAAAALNHRETGKARHRLHAMRPQQGPFPTVEVAWSLMALAVDRESTRADDDLAQEVADRLLSSFAQASGLFPHEPRADGGSGLRAHVACFADLIYPIQALSRYHARTGDERALDAARRCALRMCESQGEQGQWWWHHDVRTGRVVEGYPVYAVHQDAMGPMALFALEDACGDNHMPAIERGVAWLLHAEEIGGTLIDPEADLIWRKVARREPRKLSRRVQAAAARVHPKLRVPGLAAVMRPVSVDFECRPYHLGWLLYAWAGRDLEP